VRCFCANPGEFGCSLQTSRKQKLGTSSTQGAVRALLGWSHVLVQSAAEHGYVHQCV
jgi:hypothetical protein